jgi:hypothetical protein
MLTIVAYGYNSIGPFVVYTSNKTKEELAEQFKLTLLDKPRKENDGLFILSEQRDLDESEKDELGICNSPFDSYYNGCGGACIYLADVIPDTIFTSWDLD